ncbi:methionyl-tRNA formyltransferase [Litoribacter populi]|uniref:methionyl-tRNA formyltransferase n=1 Tax=Litoribacter populi TaxID=2598460 RepID=UPI001180C40E|nr:formyltransferase family protein [Litoribacter populi]
MSEKIKLLYMGPDYPHVLDKSKKVDIRAVAKLSELYEMPVRNIAERHFMEAYKSICKGDYDSSRKYLKRYRKLKFLANELVTSFETYLETLITKKITILDTTADDIAERINQLGIKLFLVNGWTMLPASFLSIPELGSINVHPSKLPQYRGSLPLLWVLKNKDTTSAISYILLNAAMDGGKLIRQVEYTVDKNDDPISLEKKTMNVINDSLVETVDKYVEGELTPIDQDHEKASKTARYNNYKKIDFLEETARDINHKIINYAYYDPTAPSYFKLAGQKIKLSGCIGPVQSSIAPGTIQMNFPFLYIGAKDGALKFSMIENFGLKDTAKIISMLLIKDPFSFQKEITISS